MKRLLSVMCCLLFVSGSALGQAGQAGSIDIFSDAAYASCNIDDVVPGVIETYIVHTHTPGARESWFRLVNPPCNSMVFLHAMIAEIIIPENDIFEGVGVVYGACMASPIPLASVFWMAQGLTPPCCYLSIGPALFASSGQIEAVDCDYNLMFPTGGQAIINPTPECTCAHPVHGTTWGGIKSVYR